MFELRRENNFTRYNSKTVEPANDWTTAKDIVKYICNSYHLGYCIYDDTIYIGLDFKYSFKGKRPSIISDELIFKLFQSGLI